VSQSDSFIDEVSEEVRRDRLYGYMRRYGWIAILAVILIVAGASWREYQAANQRAAAQAYGSALLEALDAETPAARAAALADVEAPEGGAAALKALLRAGEQAGAEGADPAAVAETLNSVGSLQAADIYGQIATYKALTREGASAEERRIGFEQLAQGGPLRLLAQEQLALLDIEAGETDAAIETLRAIVTDSEARQGLRTRAAQLIVALGGTVSPETEAS
jgi:hypothetical protein